MDSDLATPLCAYNGWSNVGAPQASLGHICGAQASYFPEWLHTELYLSLLPSEWAFSGVEDSLVEKKFSRV